jgi:serine/threonine protein kinase
VSGESSFQGAIQPPPVHAVQRFEHYELVTGKDGKSVELGRGAMGITYKAFDVDLRCPVTLKVINERYLGDKSAWLRFLREARAAASVRHTNVASVFHLGRTGDNYFYAMEFVEGETLQNLIKRSGRLDVKLALENCHFSTRFLSYSSRACSIARLHRSCMNIWQAGWFSANILANPILNLA